MTRKEIDYFLGSRLIARLATNDPDGYPRVTPVWYYWDKSSVFIDLGKNRASTKNLRRDPKCAVIVDVDDRPILSARDNLVKAVLIMGEARLFDVMSDADELPFQVGGEIVRYSYLADLIDRRYLPNISEDHKVFEKLLSEASPTNRPQLQGEKERVVVNVTPRRMKGWDFSKSPFKEQDE